MIHQTINDRDRFCPVCKREYYEVRFLPSAQEGQPSFAEVKCAYADCTNNGYCFYLPVTSELRPLAYKETPEWKARHEAFLAWRKTAYVPSNKEVKRLLAALNLPMGIVRVTRADYDYEGEMVFSHFTATFMERRNYTPESVANRLLLNPDIHVFRFGERNTCKTKGGNWKPNKGGDRQIVVHFAFGDPNPVTPMTRTNSK